MMLGKVLVAPQGAYKKCIFPDAAKPLIPHRKWVFKDVLERWPSSAFFSGKIDNSGVFCSGVLKIDYTHWFVT